MNKHIKKYLKSYLKLDKPEFAVLLTGKWGSGKTYFIDKFIKNNEIKDEKLNKKKLSFLNKLLNKFINETKDEKQEKIKFIKISLFGLKELDAIDEQIFQNLHPFLGHKYTKLGGALIKNSFKFGIKLDWNDDKKSDGSSNIDASKFNLLDWFSDKKSKEKIIFIFDDLERTDIELTEILGYINYLVEQSEFNVIILANEEKIIEEEDKNESTKYKEFKEKVIGKTFIISQDINSIVSSIVNNNSILLQNKDVISNIFNNEGEQNIRILKQIINEYTLFLETIDKNYKNNELFLKELINEYLSLAFFIRFSFSDRKKFQSHLSEQKTNNKLKLFNNQIWEKILFEYNSINLNDLIKDLHFFIEKKERPSWLKLYEYKTLSDSEFSSVVKETQNNFNDLKYIKEPHELIYIVDILLYLTEHKLLDSNKDEIEKILKEYLTNNELWKEYIKSNDKVKAIGYRFFNIDDILFIELKDMVIDKFNTLKEAYTSEQLDIKINNFKEKLSRELKTNQNISELWDDDVFKNMNFFDIISVDEYINIIKEKENKYILNSLGIVFRYTNHDNVLLLINELDNWKKVSTELKKYCKNISNRTLNIHLIERFIKEEVETIISILENKQKG